MKNKSPLILIFLVVFIDLLGFGLVIPILPYYARQHGANASVLGWLMASYSIMQFISAPLWGKLSDHWGRRPVIVLSVLGTGLSMLLLSFAQSLEALFIGRILAGTFGGNISAASAYIADVTPEKDRAKGMGIIGAGFGLGFIFGPAVGGILASRGYGTPALAAAILALFNSFFCLLFLKEPPLSRVQRFINRRRFDLKNLLETLTRSKTRYIVLTFFIVTFGFTQLEAVFALFMLARFSFGAKEAGWCLAYMGILMVLLQGGLIHKLVKKFGEEKLTIIGTCFMGLSLILIAYSYRFSSSLIAMTFLAIGQGLNTPSLMSLVSKSAPPGKTGTVMGIYQSAGSLARIIGPPTAGFLFDRFGVQSPLLTSATLMLLASCLGIFWFLKKS